jgi:hypothetical protein
MVTVQWSRALREVLAELPFQDEPAQLPVLLVYASDQIGGATHSWRVQGTRFPHPPELRRNLIG